MCGCRAPHADPPGESSRLTWKAARGSSAPDGKAQPVGHSMHTSSEPIFARMKSGAGHEAWQMEPVHALSLPRGMA